MVGMMCPFSSILLAQCPSLALSVDCSKAAFEEADSGGFEEEAKCTYYSQGQARSHKSIRSSFARSDASRRITRMLSKVSPDMIARASVWESS
jgi:hypothetical protein